MNKILNWGKSTALTMLIIGSFGGLKAQATNQTSVSLTTPPKTPSAQLNKPIQLAQSFGLQGQCWATRDTVFVYRSPGSDPVRIEPLQQVTIAESNANNGWIAISSPVVGFVPERQLQPCGNIGFGNNPNVINFPPPGNFPPSNGFPNTAFPPDSLSSTVFPAPTPIPPPLNPPTSVFFPPTNNSFPQSSFNTGNGNNALCRRVIFEEQIGLIVRQGPGRNHGRAGKVYFQDQVILSNPPQVRSDNKGREWVRISAPNAGWVSNGFGRGDSNLGFCL